MMAVPKPIDPATRRRNRILAMILILATLAVAAGGVFYLREYGFAVKKEQNIYH